jgi:hypothetical protein
MVRGLPDHYKHTVISRREIALELLQDYWWFSVTWQLDPGEIRSFLLDTVPAGRRVFVESVSATSDTARVLQEAELLGYDGEDYWRMLDLYFIGNASAVARTLFPAGWEIWLQIYNRDPYKSRRIRVVGHGYSEQA